MKRTKRRPVKKRVVRSWKQARVMFERCRVNLTNVQVELKLPWVTGVTPIDFIGGGPMEEKGSPKDRFDGQLIYFTEDDVTIRRSSGAILVIVNFEIAAISDGMNRFETQ